ncbi:hypothetical protein GGX14DRAFT_388571 [Mycena pura]|uniref:BTB domain-containing protein n=1 Tax=Mycena pura TaxID=153505 RepID=A0AAD6VV78_9AGAR|nr:hypothetical protein GGX14DRAFT_388571 [Mycena pura]
MEIHATKPRVPLRVQELWFSDGTIVLQAGNSQFRVYQGILAARSPVFKDMLSVPQPEPEDTTLIEGCHTTFDIVVGCLRLSHKYDVGYLRRRALVHLSSGFRMTLAAMDAAFDAQFDSGRSESESKSPPLLKTCSWVLPHTATFSIRAIHLVREVGALWLLPHAFFELSTTFAASSRAGQHVFEGIVHEDISISL